MMRHAWPHTSRPRAQRVSVVRASSSFGLSPVAGFNSLGFGVWYYHDSPRSYGAITRIRGHPGYRHPIAGSPDFDHEVAWLKPKEETLFRLRRRVL